MSQKITILVAFDKNRTIGRNGSIPWRCSEDMKNFKNRTTGNTVIMGRKTYESLPVKPLSNRLNIVVSSSWFDLKNKRDKEPCGDNLFFSKNLIAAIKLASDMESGKDLFIIGGGSIYEEALKYDLVTNIIVSLIDGDYGIHDGDIKFPELDNRWEIVNTKNYNSFKEIEYRNIK